MVIDLFEVWAGNFGAKLQGRQKLDIKTAETWAVALKLLNASKNEFEQALAISLCLEWPPTAAYDFLALARPDLSKSYQDATAAYRDAANGTYKHEVVYETARRVGFWELKTKPESVTLKSWLGHYSDVCKEHAQGSQFALPEAQQVTYEHTPVKAGSEADKLISERLKTIIKPRGKK